MSDTLIYPNMRCDKCGTKRHGKRSWLGIRHERCGGRFGLARGVGGRPRKDVAK